MGSEGSQTLSLPRGLLLSPGWTCSLIHTKGSHSAGPWGFTGTIALNNSQKTSSTSLGFCKRKQLSGRGHGALEMGSAVIPEQNWKSKQVKPRPSPGWLYSMSLVTRRGADGRAGAGQDSSGECLGPSGVDPVFGWGFWVEGD